MELIPDTALVLAETFGPDFLQVWAFQQDSLNSLPVVAGLGSDSAGMKAVAATGLSATDGPDIIVNGPSPNGTSTGSAGGGISPQDPSDVNFLNVFYANDVGNDVMDDLLLDFLIDEAAKQAVSLINSLPRHNSVEYG